MIYAPAILLVLASNTFPPVTVIVINKDTGKPIHGADVSIEKEFDGSKIDKGKTDRFGVFNSKKIDPLTKKMLIRIHALGEATHRISRYKTKIIARISPPIACRQSQPYQRFCCYSRCRPCCVAWTCCPAVEAEEAPCSACSGALTVCNPRKDSQIFSTRFALPDRDSQNSLVISQSVFSN